MAKDKATPVGGREVAPCEVPRSRHFASRGIRTDDDAAGFLSAMIADVDSGAVSERRAMTQCRLVSEMRHLKMMRHRIGAPTSEAPRTVSLVSDTPPEPGPTPEEALRAELLAKLAALDAASKERAGRR